jgi:hypothetical protein
MVEATKVKTTTATKIPGLIDKYSQGGEFAGLPVIEWSQKMLLDIYQWAEDNKFQILSIVPIPLTAGIEYIIVYK